MAQDTPVHRATFVPDPRRWLALVVILAAGIMDLVDVTIVNVAVPTILEDLDAAYAEVEWVIAGYVLGFAALLITGGRLGDTFGRRRLFLIGVAGFTVASALAGVAVDPGMLIGARFLQGAMAGLMVPQILSIIHVSFPAEERGKVFGIWGGVLGGASALGLILGGVLVQWNLWDLEWRPIFLVNIPIGIAAFVAGWFLVPESTSPSAPRVDLIGMVLAIAAVAMVVYPLTEGRSLGWPAWTYGLMIGSVVVLGLFVAYERWRTRTIGSPVVVLSLFRSRVFTAGMASWLVFWIALGGFFLIMTLYMQVGLSWSPLRAGMTTLAFALGAMVGSATSVQVFTPRFGRSVLLAGALINATGFAYYAWLAAHYGPSVSSLQMIVPLAITGIGFGLVVAPMVDAVLTGVPIRDAGSASGLLSTIQQVGMAIGVGLVGVVFFAQLADDSDRGVDKVVASVGQQLTAAGVPAAQQPGILAGFRQCVHERSSAVDPYQVPASCLPRPGQPGAEQIQQVLTTGGLQANAHNFARTFAVTLWYAVGLMVLVFFGLFGLPRKVEERDIDAELEAAAEAVREPAGRA